MAPDPARLALADLARTASLYATAVDAPDFLDLDVDQARADLLLAIERAEQLLDRRPETEAPPTQRRRARPRGHRRP